MGAPDFYSTPFQFQDPRQQRIYEELREVVGPGPAAFFRDACFLMEHPQALQSTAHLVAHCLREIESALRSVLKPVATEALKHNAGPISKKAEIKEILQVLGIADDSPEAKAWFELAGKLHGMAHRRGLEGPRSVAEVEDLWERAQILLPVVLKGIRERFLSWVSILDELHAKPQPTENDLQRFCQEVPSNLVARGYFFDKLESPEWLAPLWEKGFFQHPPEPQIDQEHNTVSFPPWPEVHYLARMAAHKPEVVKEIILQMPDTTNIHVIYNLADAMLNMSPDIAVQLGDKAKEWADSSPALDPLLADKLGKLISHLAYGGQPKVALSLAETLLEILPDPAVKGEQADDDVFGESYAPSPKPKAKLDPWHYEELLKKCVPGLIRAGRMDALKLLCDLLDKALCFSQRRKENKTDYSHVWCPAVEEHPHNINGDLKNALVDSIRDAADLLIREDLAQLSEVVGQLESHSWPIFHRIALHLLRRFPEKAPDLIADHLMDRSKLGDPNLMHEYSLLLGERFKTLTGDQRKAILEWIDQGPDLAWMGSDVSAEEGEERRKSWQLRRLTWIKDDLTGKWKKHYETLVEELGELEHPEFPTYMSTGWIGPISPKTVDELQVMDVAEIVEFLKTWKPTGDSRFEPAPEPEGLGRSLAKAISQRPEQFAAMATEFQGLDPTYVRALISGLHEAAKQGKAFDWEPVLRLCHWVVEQPREIVGGTVKRFEADPHWGWTRKEIARLIQLGVGKDFIDFDLRSRVWEILSPITDDPDPTPEDESSSGLNPLELAINTTRGEAIDAIIHYATWVRRHLKNFPDGKERLDRGFAEMTEARRVLEKHLDPEHDPSLAVHSIYGLEFPRLVLLDTKWAEEKAFQIFPLEESRLALWGAAWQAYIVYNQPYNNVFDVLRSQYAFAVEHMDLSEEKQRSPGDPDDQLAQHLMAFYWWGKIELDDPLLAGFWGQAPSSLRKDALGFIGRSLRGTKGKISPEILGRLKHLWEERLDLAKQSPEYHKSELSAFGWWFISRKFEDEWAISQLLDVLSTAGKVERDHSVIEQLVALVDRMPLQCILCLRAIAEGDRERWRIYMAREHVRTILSAALHSSDNEAVKEARKLINYLGSRGYLEFGDLLKPA